MRSGQYALYHGETFKCQEIMPDTFKLIVDGNKAPRVSGKAAMVILPKWSVMKIWKRSCRLRQWSSIGMKI